MTVTDTVTELLDPVVTTMGVELVDVEFNGGVLRVTVDQPDGITTDVLASVNRTISPILDQHDPIPGRYTLEVTSPGVERKLSKVAHFERAIGENVVVKLEPGNEPRRYKGELLGVEPLDGSGAELKISAVEIDGVDLADAEIHVVAMADIAKARTVFKWGPGPKPGKSKKNKQ